MLNYEELQNIEINATNKLLIYIDSLIDIHKLYDEVRENFNFFKDESSRLAFNSWLTIDYNPREENTFIEDFLKKVPNNLNQLEKNILRGKSNSYISLLEIKKIYSEYLIVNDILNDMEYKLWEPKLKGLMKEGEIFLARVGKSLDNYRFIGDINYLPISVKPIFMENLLVDFNAMRKKDSELDIRKYLKTHTLNVYKIYEDAISNVQDVEYQEDYLLFSQLEEFEGYLSSKLSPLKVKNHMHNLMNIYEYKLEDSNMNIKDILLLDLKVFLKDALEDEFILTKEEFNSYLDTLKSYLGFLSSMDKKYLKSYYEILNVSQNRFKYTKYMKSQSGVFHIDQSLVNIIGKFLDNDMMILLKDLDNFLSIIDELNPKLTKKNKFISRSDLYEINENLSLKSIPLSKAPNQEDYPLIDFFYFLSLHLDVSEVIGDRLFLKDNINYLFRLKDEERYFLICAYLLDGNFVMDRYPEKDIRLIDDSHADFKDFLDGLEDFKGNASILKLLSFLSIIRYKVKIQDQSPSIEITSFGKALINYIIKDNKKEKTSNIVYLESLKNN